MTLFRIGTCNICYTHIIGIIFNSYNIPTQLDSTWLPDKEKVINSDLLGWLSGTHQVTKEVFAILENLGDRKYRWLQSIPIFKKLEDHHSAITSDDLLWYIQGKLSEEEFVLLKDIKIKWDSMVIPRALSRKINDAIKWIGK